MHRLKDSRARVCQRLTIEGNPNITYYNGSTKATSCSDNPRVLWFGIGAVYIIPLTKARNARSANSKCQIQVLA